MVREIFDTAAGAYVDAVGTDVEYNGPNTIRAVFGSQWLSVQSGDVRVSSRRPEIYVRLADLPAGAAAALTPGEPGDTVDVLGTLFEVATVKPDLESVGVTLVLKLVD